MCLLQICATQPAAMAAAKRLRLTSGIFRCKYLDTRKVSSKIDISGHRNAAASRAKFANNPNKHELCVKFLLGAAAAAC
jgi:hypothetical protein